MLNSVEEEIRRTTNQCCGEARRSPKGNRDKLDGIVKQLLIRETGAELEAYNSHVRRWQDRRQSLAFRDHLEET